MKIKYRFPLIIFPILLVSLLYLGNIWFSLTKTNYDNLLKNEVKILSLKKANAIQNVIDKMESDLILLSTSPWIREYTDIKGRTDGDEDLHIKFITTFLKKGRVYKGFTFADMKGDELIRLYSTPALLQKRNVSETGYFRETVKLPEGSILKFFSGNDLIYSAGVFSKDNRLTGIITLEFDYEGLRGLVKEPNREASPDIILFDGKGGKLMDIFSSGKITEHTFGKIKDMMTGTDQAYRDRTIFLKGETTDFIFATSPVTHFDWHVFSCYRYADFASSIAALWKRALGFSLAVLLASVLLVYFISLSAVAPISRLAANVQLLKEGSWEKVKGPISRDEIGDLTMKFNEMADTIKEKQDRLQDAYEKLRETQDKMIRTEKLAAIGELAAGIAHEINNPLNNILGYVSLLKKSTSLNPDEFRKLEIILQQIDRCLAIMDGLLDFSRARTLILEQADLSGIIQNAAEEARVEFSMKEENFEISLEKEMTAYIDREKIRRVFFNIIKNACEAVAFKGTISISARKENGSITIMIRDNGEGIPPENIEKIFMPFFSTRTEQKGTGLGLSLSRGIIEDHGGEIKVSSRKGETIFEVKLPQGAA